MKTASSRLMLVATCFALLPGSSHAQNECFSSGSIAGAVLGTFFSTVAVAALAFLIWRTCRPRQTPGGTAKSRNNVNIEGGSGFDNPCFEEHHQHSDNANNGAGREDPTNKATSWTPLRFFGTSRGEKKRSLDDSFIAEPEHVSVQLRGHDFTGLGFNVVGNMRDGIYVKDILNRGPAFESGKVAPGDKILSVKISFRHMVYEDALTILSYASPYDVTLMLEKGSPSSTLKVSNQRKATSSVSLAGSLPSVTGVSSAEGFSMERLVHPLYRSQSIDDLSRVGHADAVIKADMKIPSLSGGVLAKSKLQGKSNLEFSGAALPDLRIKGQNAKADVTLSVPDISVEKPAKMSKFGVKVLPNMKLKTTDEAKTPILDISQSSDASVSIDVPDGAVALSLPSVQVDVPEIHDPKVSMEKGKSGFSIKFPKFGGGGKRKADGPKVKGGAEVGIAMPDADAELQVKGKKDVNLKMPKLSGKQKGAGLEVKVEPPQITVPTVDVSLQKQANAGEINLRLPKVKAEALSADYGASFKGPGFDLGNADISLKAPDASVKIDMPKLSADDSHSDDDEKKKLKLGFKMPKWHGSKPSAELDVKLPEAELPDFNVKVAADVDDIEKEKKKTRFGIKLPGFHMEKPSVQVEGNIDAALPEVNFEVDGPDGDKKKGKPGFHMPKMNLGKAEIELDRPQVDASTEVPSVDFKLKHEGSDKDVDIDPSKKKSKFGMKMPKFGLEKPNIQLEGPELPDIDISVKKPQLNIEPGSMEAAIDVPSVDLTVGHGDIELDASKKKSKFGIKLPKFGLDKPDIELEGPEIPDVDISVKKPKINLEPGSMEAAIDVPSVDFTVGHGDIELDASKKKSKFGIKLPKFGLDKPEIELEGPEIPDVDISLKKPKINLEPGSVEASIDVPSVDLTVGHGDIDLDASKKKSKFGIKLPKFGLDKPDIELEGPEIPDVDISVKKPKINLEPGSMEAAIDVPSVDLTIGHGDIELDASKKKSKFGIKLPKFGLDKPDIELEGPEISDVDISVKKPKINLEPGSMEAAIDVPSVDLTIGHGDIELDASKKKSKFGIKLPKFGLDKPDIELEGPEIPDVDISVRKPNINVDPGSIEAAADIDISMKKPQLNIDPGNIEAAIEVPSVDLKVGHGDIELDPSKKKSKFGIKMPKFGLDKPNIEFEGPELPDINISMKKPTVSADIGSIEAAIDVPNVDVDVGHGDIELDESKKKSKFGIKLPRFGMDKPHIELEGPELPDVKVSVNKATVALKPGNLEAALDVPNVDLNLGHGDIELDASKKKSKFGFKMPKFGIEKPDIELEGPEVPDIDISVKKPQLNIEPGSIEAGIDVPGVDLTIGHGDIDIDASKKKSKFGIKLPKFGLDKPNIELEGPEIPDVDISVKKPQINLEPGSIEAALDVPSVDLKVGHDDIELDGSRKKSKFGIKLPKFGLDKPDIELEGHEIPDMDISLKRPQLDVKPGSIEAAIDVPNVDLKVGHGDFDLDGSKKKSKFGIKLPKFGLEKPDIELEGPEIPDVDISVKKPKISLEPGSIEAAIDVPSVDLEVDHDGVDLDPTKKKSKFGIKLPKFGLDKPNIELEGPEIPDVDISVKKPQINVDPGSFEAAIDVPSVDLKVGHEDIELGGSKKKGKFGIKLPKLEVEKPNIELKAPQLPDIDFSLKKPQINVQPGSVEASVDVPSVDLKGGHGSLELDTSKKKSKFGFKMPKFGADKPHIELEGTDIPDVDIAVKKPKVNVEPGSIEAAIEVPTIDVKVGHDDIELDASKKKSKFGFKMPKFGTDKPHVELEGPEIPDVNISVKKPQINLEPGSIQAGIEVPSVDLKVGHDDIEVDASKKKSKFGFKMPKFGVDKPNIELEGPEFPDVDISVKKPKVNVEPGNVEAAIDVPSVDLKIGHDDIELDASKKKSKFSFKMPKFGVDKPRLDVEAGAELPAVDVKIKHGDTDSEDESSGSKKKGKFGFKMPKFGMDKPHVDLDAGASASVELPSVELHAKHDESDDETIGTKKKGKFSFKMPKFGVDKPHVEMGAGDLETGASVHLPSVDVKVDSGDINVESGYKKKAKFGIKLPKVGIEKPHLEVTTEDVEGEIDLPSVDIKTQHGESDSEDEHGTKKKTKFGIKLPKFGLEKPHMELEPGQVGGEVSVALPKVDVDVSGAELEIGDPEIAKKKGKFGLKMSKFGLDKPDVDFKAEGEVRIPGAELEIDAGDIELEGDVKKKGKFGIKMPKFGMDKPSIDVNLPSVDFEMKHDDSESEDDEDGTKKKKRFGLKMPKLGLDKPEVDLKAEGELKLPSAKLEIDAGEIELDEDVKKKGKFGIKMPKFGLDKPSIDVNLPSIDLAVEHDESESEDDEDGTKKKKKFGLKMPKFGLDKPDIDFKAEGDVKLPSAELEVEGPEVDLDGDFKKKSKFGIKMPKFGLDKPDIDLKAEGEVKLPSDEIEVERADIEFDGDLKKKSKFGIKMPKFGLDKPSVDINLPSVDLELKHDETDSEDDQDGTKKKKKFGIKLPKFGLDKPEIELQGPEIPDVDVSIKKPKVNMEPGSMAATVDVPNVDLTVGHADMELDASKKKSKFGIKMPKFGLDKPDVDVKVEGDVKLPSVDIDVNAGDLELESDASTKKAKVGLKMPKFGFEKPTVDINLPTVDIDFRRGEVDSDDDSSEGKKKFGLKLPKFGLDKPDVNLGAKADVELPDADIEVSTSDLEFEGDLSLKKKGKLGFKMPKFGLDLPTADLKAEADVKLPRADLDAEAPDVEVEGDFKKKGKFGIKMPKFGLDKPSIDVNLPSVNLEVKHDDTDSEDDVEGTKKKTRFGLKMPKFGLDKPDIDLKATGEIELPSADIEVKTGDIEIEGDVKKKGKFAMKMPKFGLDKPEVDLKASGEVELPNVDFEIKTGEAELEGDLKKKGKFGMKMPKFGLDKPSIDVNLPSVDLEVEHDETESEDDEQGTKRKKFGLKMPKFGFDKPEVDLKAGGEVKLPGADLEFDAGDIELEGDLKKKSKFGIKMPKFGLEKPSIDVNLPSVDLEIKRDETESEDEEGGGKKKKKFGLKMPKFGLDKPEVDFKAEGEVKVPSANLEIESGDVELEGDLKKKTKYDLKMPKLGLEKPSIDVNLPSLDVQVKHDDSDTEDEENGTKKKKTFGLKMPNLGLDKPSVKAEGEVELPSIDVDVRAGGIEVEGDANLKKKGKFNFKMPKFGLEKPHIDLETGYAEAAIDVPDVNLSTGVEVPEGAALEVNLPNPSAEIDLTLPQVKVGLDKDDDENGDKKKKSFGLKMPKMKIGHPHADVNIKGAKLQLPEVGVEVEHDSDSESETKEKKKSKFGLKMPKFQLNRPEVSLHEGIDVDVQPPSLDIETETNGDHLEGKKKGKIGLKASKPKISKPEIDLSAGKDIEVSLDAPKIDLRVDHDFDSDDDKLDGKKKKSKFGLKMPKFHGNKPGVDVDVTFPELPQVSVEHEANVTVPSVTLDANLEGNVGLPQVEADLKLKESGEIAIKEGKKKGKFSFKMPKFHAGVKGHPEMEVPTVGGDLGIETDVNLPRLDVKTRHAEESDDDDSEKKFSLGLNLPKVQVNKSQLDAQLDLPAVELPSVEVKLEGGEREAEKKSKFAFKMPKFHSSKPHAELELDASKDLKLGAKVEAPSLELEAKLDADTEKSDKKKTKFGLKMPDFHLHRPHAEVNLTAPSDIRVSGPALAIRHDEDDANADGKNAGFELRLPKVELGKPDIKLDISKTDIAIGKPSVDISLPEVKPVDISATLPAVELKGSGLDIDVAGLKLDTDLDVSIKAEKKTPKFGIKLPTIDFGKTKVGVSDIDIENRPAGVEFGLEAPSISLERSVETDITAPTFKIKAPEGSIDFVRDIDVAVGPVLEVPEVDITAGTLNIDAPKVDIDSKGFGFGLKMPKFKAGKDKANLDMEVPEPTSFAVSTELPTVQIQGPQVTAEADGIHGKEKDKKRFSIGLKMPKSPDVRGKKKGDHSVDDSSDDEHEAKLKAKFVDADVKLPRISLKSSGDAHGDSDEESSEDEEKTSKEIKKNIGARFGVKLKKPKLFTSNKADISSKDKEPQSAALSAEWKLPRVDLRKNTKLDEELVIATNVDYELPDHLEQMSPSERAEALRRDSKVSSGIRMPTTTTSITLSSPRAKAKASLPHLEIDSSPRLLSITRLDPTPPIEFTPAQVSVNDVPASLLMASDAVKMRRGPPVPAKRTSVTSLISTISNVSTAIVTAGSVQPNGSDNISLHVQGPSEANLSPSRIQVSDSNIHVSAAVAPDIKIISTSSEGRKAASMGDLTRIGPVNVDDGTLERTVSLDLNPISSGPSTSSSRAIHNLAVQDLSRVGEDSDEELAISRKRPNQLSDVSLEITGDVTQIPTPAKRGMNRTLLAVDTDGTDVNIRPLDANSAEALWFAASTGETASAVSLQQLEGGDTDVTLTASLGSSPSDTASSSGTNSPTETPDYTETTIVTTETQIESTNGTEYHREIIEITREELQTISFAPISPVSTSIRRFSTDLGSSSQELSPSVVTRTELNPSADTFAAVRSRFEQLSQTNGSETSPTRVSNRGQVKRFSGNFDESTLVQKSVLNMAPEVSEGALSRTVIISSLHLERSNLEQQQQQQQLGPESPVPSLEPPC